MKWSDPNLLFGWSYVLFSISNRIPQILRNYRRKSAEDLSRLSFLCQLMSSILFACHGVMIEDPTAQVCGVVAVVQCVIILVQMHMYKKPI